MDDLRGRLRPLTSFRRVDLGWGASSPCAVWGPTCGCTAVIVALMVSPAEGLAPAHPAQMGTIRASSPHSRGCPRPTPDPPPSGFHPRPGRGNSRRRRSPNPPPGARCGPQPTPQRDTIGAQSAPPHPPHHPVRPQILRFCGLHWGAGRPGHIHPIQYPTPVARPRDIARTPSAHLPQFLHPRLDLQERGLGGQNGKDGPQLLARHQSCAIVCVACGEVHHMPAHPTDPLLVRRLARRLARDSSSNPRGSAKLWAQQAVIRQ